MNPGRPEKGRAWDYTQHLDPSLHQGKNSRLLQRRTNRLLPRTRLIMNKERLILNPEPGSGRSTKNKHRPLFVPLDEPETKDSDLRQQGDQTLVDRIGSHESSEPENLKVWKTRLDLNTSLLRDFGHVWWFVFLSTVWSVVLHWGDLRTKPPWCCRRWCSDVFLVCSSPPVRSVPAPSHRCSALITTCVLLFLVSCAEAQKSPAFHRADQPKVCGNIDIRNSVDQFHKLDDCEVVEGDLQIVLITNGTGFINISFPKLREVTGFVVLWRVNGLYSLGTLFPNLAVIRGRTLFENYALVAYEMHDLMEVGIYSLTNILRGSVRFDKNARLCYVDTIDWNLIAPNGANGHVIKDNRPRGECSRCPANYSEYCVTSPEHRCWNKDHCQRSNVCHETGSCCHEHCLGGCSGPTSRDCRVCRDVLLNGECVKECPPNTYKFLDRRCVTAEECYEQPRPVSRDSYPEARFSYRPIKKECVTECPAGYVEKDVSARNRTRYACVPCDGPCKKECTGQNVDSISAAQRLAGCTHITGSGLEINLRHGGSRNLMRELEKSLSSIEEIDGYLKVVRSFPLVSLNFLKNLRVIHGNTLDNHNSSFVLLDNQNLEDLWDWNLRQTQNLTIKQGKLFFHFNPRLCYYKIEDLRNRARLAPFTDLEVPRDSNGDKEACNLTSLHPSIERIRATSALITWPPWNHHDPRTLLGYVVSYVRAPFQNVSYYDGRDACGGDGWKVDDTPIGDPNAKINYIIPHLEPNTQYAFYVKTYTIKYETRGGRSNITYFTTAPGTPTKPNYVQARANSSSEIIITWSPPTKVNGELLHYVVTGKVEDDDFMPPDRNYCTDPLMISNIDHPPLPPPTPPPARADDCPCNQTDGKEHKETDEAVRADAISFENYVQNYFYVKRTVPKTVVKRSVPINDLGRESNGLNGPRSVLGGKFPDRIDKERRSFEFKVNETKLVVKNLIHFKRYTISVQACRKRWQEGDDAMDPCSVTVIVYERTKKNDTADIIPDIHVSQNIINGTSLTIITWTEPVKPNGLIQTYKIERSRNFAEKEGKLTDCVVRPPGHAGYMTYNLTNLEPGNYSFRIQAVSLAQSGPFSRSVFINIETSTQSGLTDAWIGVILAILFIMVFVIGFVVYWRHINPQVPKLFPSVNPEYVSASSVYISDDWEIPREKVELIKELGQGSFGMVYEGIAHGLIEGQPHVRCAVKTVNEVANDRDRHEFLNEASVMKAFNTHHVVRLLGVVSKGQPTLVVMELMLNGDLKTYLRNHRPEAAADGQVVVPPTLRRIMQMALEIADGMAYLTAKKFVHRDLAARNCMVADDLTVKIGDFGMTRDIYETDYYKKGTKGLLPVRWMAPESLKDGVFTSRSDIWSYGVVLWEMVTLASQPYLGLSNDQVLKYVTEGGVMERPENCPDKLYELMQLCWQHRPHMRPQFMDLVTRLLPEANEAFFSVSFYHSPEGQEIRVHMADTQVVELDATFGTPLMPLRATTEELDSEDFSSVCSGSDVEEGESNVLSLLPPSRPAAPVISSSDSSRGSKVSNGSAQMNGYITTKTTPC